MYGRLVLRLLLVPFALASCSKSTEDPAPSQPAAAASKSVLQGKARADAEERARAEALQKKADEEATRLVLADEAEAKARAADQNATPFHGKTAAQLKAAARRECRIGKCAPDVLDQIFEAARPEESESVRCVVRFEEDSWSCRQGINPALCNPPPCQ